MDISEIKNLVAYFIIYSFIGWVLESILKSFLQKKFVNSGFINGPFCPIYGFGAIIMYLFLDNFKSNLLLLFIMSFIVLSVWEYIVGYVLEKIFKTKYWDYSNNRFNIQGRVCLLNSMYWAILGIIFTLFLHPIVIDLVNKIPDDVLTIVELILGAYLIIDIVISIIKATNLNIRLVKLEQIAESIKEKIAELKQQSLKNGSNEKLKEIIEELKQKQENLKQKLYKQTSRLTKAFPTIKSEKLNKFLNQNIDNIKNNKK